MSEGGVVTQVPLERSVKLERHSEQSEGRGPPHFAQLSAHGRHSVTTAGVSAGEEVLVAAVVVVLVAAVVVAVEVLAVVELLVEVFVCASDVDAVGLESEELAPLAAAAVAVVVGGVDPVEVFDVSP